MLPAVWGEICQINAVVIQRDYPLEGVKKAIMSRSFAGMWLQEFCGVQLAPDALAGLASVCLLSH